MGIVLIWGSGCTSPKKPESIVDGQGRIVLYHGVNASNYSKSSEDHQPWQTREDFARLNEWGFNLVRLLIFWEAVEPSSGSYDDKYMAAVLERVQWLQELGIDVLLDLHQDLYNRKFGGNGFPDWTVDDGGYPFTMREPWNLNYLEPAVLTCYDRFWRSEVLKTSYVEMLRYVYSKVDKLPNVIGLEIMNEPWPLIGAGFEKYVLTDFYESIEKMKAANHYQLPLYFEAAIFTSAGIPSGLRYTPQSAAVYSAHYYDPFCHEGKPYSEFGRWLMKTALYRRIAEAHRAGTPLMYTEFGISPDVTDYDDFLNDLIGLMDTYQVSWTYYTYDKGTGDSFGLIDDSGNTRPNIDPLIQIYPQRIAGKNASWRREANRFTLMYDGMDTPAPTVIFVPRKLQVTKVTVNGSEVPFDHYQSLCFEYSQPGASGRQTIVLEWK